MGNKITIGDLSPAMQAELRGRFPSAFDTEKKNIKPRRRGKYNAKRGYSVLLKRAFHSCLERDRADMLFARQRDGKIANLRFQQKIPVGDLTWNVDFLYEEDGITWAEDAKGAEDARFKVIKTIYQERGPYPLRISKRRTKTWKVETIIPNQLDQKIKDQISS